MFTNHLRFLRKNLKHSNWSITKSSDAGHVLFFILRNNRILHDITKVELK